MESQQRAPSRTKPSMRPGFMQWAVAATGAEAAAAAAPLPPSLPPSPSPISRTSATAVPASHEGRGTQAEESTAVYGTKRRGGGEDGKRGEEVEEVEEVEEEVEVTLVFGSACMSIETIPSQLWPKSTTKRSGLVLEWWIVPN